MSDYELSNGNPRDCRGFSVIYPDKVKAVQQSRVSRNPKPEKDKILNRQDASIHIGVSLATLDRMIRDKKVPFYKVANRTLFSKKRLDEWMMLREELPTTGWDVEVGEKAEQVRLAEIRKRRDELAVIGHKVYKAIESGKLNNEQHEEHSEILKNVAQESLDLLCEADEIKEKQVNRLKSLLGLPVEDK
jgi:excisionase family DNA binding protein